MKRIIDGNTYNTETATVIYQDIKFVDLAEHVEAESEDSRDFAHVETLYQTRRGDYFLVVTEPQANFDRGRPKGVRHVERLEPLTRDYALDWLRSHRFLAVRYEQLVYRLKDYQRAKERTEKSAVFLRIPQSLKERLEACAKNKGQSLNTWVMRRLEQAALDEEMSGNSAITDRLEESQNEKE